MRIDIPSVGELLSSKGFLLFEQLTDNEIANAYLAEPYHSMLDGFRKKFLGNNPISEQSLKKTLTKETEDEILQSVGFFPRETEVFDLESIRSSYDASTFSVYRDYVRNIRQRYVQGINASFLGANGSGKTTSMQLVFRYLIRAFYDSITRKVNCGMMKFTAEQLVEMVIEDKYNPKAWYYDVRVLGIDDMGVYTDTRHNALRTFLNYRLAKGERCLTLITSRLTKEQLARYSDIESRLKTGLKFWTINKDFRDIR